VHFNRAQVGGQWGRGTWEGRLSGLLHNGGENCCLCAPVYVHVRGFGVMRQAFTHVNINNDY